MSPRIYRLWAGIALVGGALERRVWTKVGNPPKTTFPNLYTLLVGPPGTGKFIVEDVRALWQEARVPGSKNPAFHVASDSVTTASLMDEMVKAKDIKIMRSGPPLTVHSLLVAAEEFQHLLPGYDQQFIATLNSLFNNKSLHKESRRTGTVKELIMENPQLNLLGGAQPAYFASTFPEEAWSTGLARRIIMVYSGECPVVDPWADNGSSPQARVDLLAKVEHLRGLYGQMKWAADGVEELRTWLLAGAPPVPTHSKLASYVRSRGLFSFKLAMISAVSRTGGMVIEAVDVRRAISWLIEVEALMPDIFREMIGKSDIQVIEEMHLFVTSLWAREKQKPVTGEIIMKFLLARVPHEKAGSILLAAERANIIARVAGAQDLFVPRPKHTHAGVE